MNVIASHNPNDFLRFLFPIVISSKSSTLSYEFYLSLTIVKTVRFSTVGGESGSADTARDPRGFAMKFYTDEG